MFYFLLIVVAFMLRANSFMHSGMVKASFRGIPLSRRSMMFAPEWTEGFNRFHLARSAIAVTVRRMMKRLSSTKKYVRWW